MGPVGSSGSGPRGVIRTGPAFAPTRPNAGDSHMSMEKRAVIAEN